MINYPMIILINFTKTLLTASPPDAKEIPGIWCEAIICVNNRIIENMNKSSILVIIKSSEL